MKRKLSAVLGLVFLLSCMSLPALATQDFDSPIINVESNPPVQDSDIPIATEEGPNEPAFPAVQRAVNPNDPVGTCSEVVEDELDSNAVSISGEISVKIGSSWSTTFNTNDLFSANHNAFKVIVPSASGSSYKVLVTNSDGWAYESNVHTSSSTVTITNVNNNCDYTVYVLNYATGTLAANVTISSYYNS